VQRPLIAGMLIVVLGSYGPTTCLPRRVIAVSFVF
jgi:hypothetical protein